MDLPKPPVELVDLRPGIADTVQHPSNGPAIGKPPAKYTVAVKDKIVEYIKAGLGPSEAAVKAGIPRPTFYSWQRKAKEGDIHLTELFEEIEAAKVELQYGLVQEVLKDPKYKNPLEVLSRIFGERWSPKATQLVHSEMEEVYSRLELEFANEPAIFARIVSCLAKE